MANYFTLLTSTGLAKITNAQLTESKVEISRIAIGDSNGFNYKPVGTETALKNEKWRGAIASMSVDTKNLNWIIVEAVVPATVGGFTLREVALYDVAGDIIAIGNYPDTYKPVEADGSTMDLVLRTIIEVSSASSVSVKVDPNVIIASRKYVDDKVAGTIGNIGTSLTELQEQVTTHLEEKGKPNGYASLNGSGKVPDTQLPALDFIPTNQKGVANGVSTLDENGLIPVEQIPDINSGAWEVLASVSINSPTTSVEFNNLPTDYDFFKIFTKNLNGVYTEQLNHQLKLKINDLTTLYSHVTWHQSVSGSTLTVSGQNDTLGSLSLPYSLPSSGQVYSSSYEITIFNTANTVKTIIADGIGADYGSSPTKLTQIRLVGTSRQSNDTNPIQKITLFASTQIKAGGKILIMGCKA